MTGPSTPANGGQPKQMSSRLLTMKFMQRAAASPSSATNTPNREVNGSSAKRRKLTDSEPSTPGTPTYSTPQSTDMRAISAALAEEERVRSAARMRMVAAEGGETEWILNLPGARTVTSGNAPIKSAATSDAQDDQDEEDEIWQTRTIGRRSYGAFKRKKHQSSSTPSTDPRGEDDEELSEVDEESDDGEAQDLKERLQEKQGQALDKMNLKMKSSVSGYLAKRGLDQNGEKKLKGKPFRRTGRDVLQCSHSVR